MIGVVMVVDKPIKTEIMIEGSWDRRKRTSFALPDIVLAYLKMKSAASDKPVQDLVLEAIIDHFGLRRGK
jgi:hypothetical protein